jgi:hypothetical protein
MKPTFSSRASAGETIRRESRDLQLSKPQGGAGLQACSKGLLRNRASAHEVRRWPLLAVFFIAALISAPRFIVRAFAAPAASTSGIKVELNASGAQPRQLEDTTQAAIVRDYGQAWKTMETALSHNNSAPLDDFFAGYALDNLKQRVNEQKHAGVTTRYVDRGHKLDAVFYSPEGSTIELHDTAQLEVQTLLNGDVIHSEPATVHYVTLMTAAEDHWKVRVLQAAPGF